MFWMIVARYLARGFRRDMAKRQSPDLKCVVVAAANLNRTGVMVAFDPNPSAPCLQLREGCGGLRA